MIFFWKDNQEKQKPNLVKLAKELQNLQKFAVLSEPEISVMKSSLLNKIEQIAEPQQEMIASEERLCENLGLELSKLAQSVKINPYQQAMLRREVLSTAENAKTHENWLSFWFNTRKILAGSMLSLFAFSFLIFYPLENDVLKASKFSLIEKVIGEVFVNRGGKLMAVNPNFALEQGDLIFTKDNSMVVIRFLDDSVARLNQNTFLEIKQLVINPDDLADTKVNLNLIEGEAWAKVPDLTSGDAEFAIETKSAKATVRDSAAFAISSNQEKTQLVVYENVVDLVKKDVTLEQVKPVVSGFIAQVDGESDLQEVVVQKQTQVETVSQHSDWVVMNQELDQKYDLALSNEKISLIKDALSNDNAFLTVWRDFQSNTKALFVNSKIENYKLEYLADYKVFLESVELLAETRKGDGKRTEALKNLNNFKASTNGLITKLREVSEEDKVEADVLLKLMKETFSLQRKQLSMVLPDENLNLAKEAIWSISLQASDNSMEKMDLLYSKSRNSLLIAQAYLKKSQYQNVDQVLLDYQNELEQYLELAVVNKIDFSKDKSIYSLFSDQLQQVKMLSSVYQDLSRTKNVQLAQTVLDLKMRNLKIIYQYLLKPDQYIPYVWLKEYQSVVENYLPEGQERNEYLAFAKSKLAQYPESNLADLNKIIEKGQLNQNELPVIEGSLITDQQATADVTKANSGVIDFDQVLDELVAN